MAQSGLEWAIRPLRDNGADGKFRNDAAHGGAAWTLKGVKGRKRRVNGRNSLVGQVFRHGTSEQKQASRNPSACMSGAGPSGNGNFGLALSRIGLESKSCAERILACGGRSQVLAS